MYIIQYLPLPATMSITFSWRLEGSSGFSPLWGARPRAQVRFLAQSFEHLRLARAWSYRSLS